MEHRSGGDALALVDDLMEPFRPSVDRVVHKLYLEGITTVPEARRDLVGALTEQFRTEKGLSCHSQVLVRLVQSLANSFNAGKAELIFPRTPLPVEDCHDGKA